MSIIRVRCVDQTLRASIVPLVASGGVNVDTVAFSFCTVWQGYEKTAVFYRDPSAVYHVLIDKDNTCIVPREVVAEPGQFYFGVFGTKGTEVLTTEVLSYPVAHGARTEGTVPPDPTPDIYAQLLDRIAQLGVGHPTPSAEDEGKVLTAAADGTTSWQAPKTDDTLTQAGQAADAAAVGRTIDTLAQGATEEFANAWEQINANAQAIQKQGAQPVQIDLTAFEAAGRIVETYADGSEVTYTMTFDADGNPIKVTDSAGNETTLTW